MLNIKKMRNEREKDILDSLQFIDTMVDIIKKQSNATWSGKQAKLLKSFYNAINEDWRRSKSIH